MQGRVGTVNPDRFPEGLLPGGGTVVIDGVGQKENCGMGRGQNDTAHGVFPFRPEGAQVAAAVDQENRTVQQGEPTHAQKGKALPAGNFIIRYPHFLQQLDFGQCNGVIAQVAVLRGQQEKDSSRMCPLPVCQGHQALSEFQTKTNTQKFLEKGAFLPQLPDFFTKHRFLSLHRRQAGSP
jgi:hypothetical protein